MIRAYWMSSKYVTELGVDELPPARNRQPLTAVAAAPERPLLNDGSASMRTEKPFRTTGRYLLSQYIDTDHSRTGGRGSGALGLGLCPEKH